MDKHWPVQFYHTQSIIEKMQIKQHPTKYWKDVDCGGSIGFISDGEFASIFNFYLYFPNFLQWIWLYFINMKQLKKAKSKPIFSDCSLFSWLNLQPLSRLLYFSISSWVFAFPSTFHAQLPIFPELSTVTVVCPSSFLALFCIHKHCSWTLQRLAFQALYLPVLIP